MALSPAQPITGVTPPQLAEARVREVYPTVAASPGIASIGRLLTGTIILAPLGWLIMSSSFLGLLPLFMKRYTLTNRRVMIRRGWKGTIAQEVPLEKIDDVRIVTDGNSDFFRAGTLEIIHGGQTAMTLPGIPEPESFRQLILNARNAWVPDKAKQTMPFIPASALK